MCPWLGVKVGCSLFGAFLDLSYCSLLFVDSFEIQMKVVDELFFHSVQGVTVLLSYFLSKKRRHYDCLYQIVITLNWLRRRSETSGCSLCALSLCSCFCGYRIRKLTDK